MCELQAAFLVLYCNCNQPVNDNEVSAIASLHGELVNLGLLEFWQAATRAACPCPSYRVQRHTFVA